MEKNLSISSKPVGWTLISFGVIHALLAIVNIVLASIYTDNGYAINVGAQLTMYMKRYPMYVIPVLYPVAILQIGAVFVMMYALAAWMMLKMGWKMIKCEADCTAISSTSGLSIYGMVFALGMIVICSVSGMNNVEILVPAFIAIVMGTAIIQTSVLHYECDSGNHSAVLNKTVSNMIVIPTIALVIMFFPAYSSMQVYGWVNGDQGGLPAAYSGMIIGSFIIFVAYFMLLLFSVLAGFSPSSTAIISVCFVTLWNLYINWFYFSINVTSDYLDPFVGLNRFIGI